MLSSAIICGSHEEAAWLYLATMKGQVTGNPDALQKLQERLDAVMAPVSAS